MRIVLLSLAIVVSGFIAGCDSKPQPYKLNDREKKVLVALLYDDLSVALQDGDVQDPELKGKLFGEVVQVSTQTLQTAYERNEVAADLAYKDKTLFVEGVVKSIDRSIGESYFIGLVGGSNPFMSPKASMADGFIQYLASLTKGTKIKLACKGGGMLIGSAMLKNCEPFDQYISKKIEAYANDSRISAASPEKTKEILLVSMLIATLLPENSKCFESGTTHQMCLSESMAILGGEKTDAKKQSFEKAMREAGVKAGLLAPFGLKPK